MNVNSGLSGPPLWQKRHVISTSGELALLFRICKKTGPFQELIEMMLSIQSSILLPTFLKIVFKITYGRNWTGAIYWGGSCLCIRLK